MSSFKENTQGDFKADTQSRSKRANIGIGADTSVAFKEDTYPGSKQTPACF